MIRVKVTFQPIRARARLRRARPLIRRAPLPMACGVAIGLGLTLARHEAPPLQIVHMVRTIETTAPAVKPETPNPYAAPHVPETSPHAWDVLGLETYPDGFIMPKRPRTSPKPPKKTKAKD